MHYLPFISEHQRKEMNKKGISAYTKSKKKAIERLEEKKHFSTLPGPTNSTSNNNINSIYRDRRSTMATPLPETPIKSVVDTFSPSSNKQVHKY
jgi:hypothetical protein